MSEVATWMGMEPEDVKHLWLQSPAVRAFETGKLPFEQFALGSLKRCPCL
jgi:hypothetical protein